VTTRDRKGERAGRFFSVPQRSKRERAGDCWWFAMPLKKADAMMPSLSKSAKI
jgi:hypothetical protein